MKTFLLKITKTETRTLEAEAVGKTYGTLLHTASGFNPRVYLTFDDPDGQFSPGDEITITIEKAAKDG